MIGLGNDFIIIIHDLGKQKKSISRRKCLKKTLLTEKERDKTT